MSREQWQPFANGSSIGQEGSEMGIIVRDEWLGGVARITLEREPRVVPFAITCGVYGWMAHTRYFGTEEEAHQAFDAMKPALAKIVRLIPGDGDPDEDEKVAGLAAALKHFTADFPAL
jgi:hypothetical protein